MNIDSNHALKIVHYSHQLGLGGVEKCMQLGRKGQEFTKKNFSPDKYRQEIRGMLQTITYLIE